MKLRDGGATVLIVIGIIYFADWLVNKIEPDPQLCFYTHESMLNDVKLEVGSWEECRKNDTLKSIETDQH